MDNTGFVVWFNPAFVASVSLDELVGVLHHEARHVIYGHILMDPAQFPDEHALLVAQETTANENLPEPLPGRPVLLADYPMLKPDEDTVTRYRRLATRGATRGTRRQATSAKSSQDQPHAGAPAGPPQDGTSSPLQAAQSQHGGGERRDAQHDDSHGRWKDIRSNGSLAKALIAAAIEESRAHPRELSEYERTLIAEACKACGIEPGTGTSALGPGADAQHVNWRRALRRFVGRAMTPSRSYMMPPRRFPHLIGIVPGTRRRQGKPVVLAVIDTSASLSDALLADICAELSFLAKSYTVTVVECDCIIHRVYRYKKPIPEVAGRGGTSFCPPLERVFLRKTHADAVVYFTDGYGSAPQNPPQVPVLWVLTPDGQAPAPWGEVLHLGATAAN
jgi:predicted metal-dependent peptidase